MPRKLVKHTYLWGYFQRRKQVNQWTEWGRPTLNAGGTMLLRLDPFQVGACFWCCCRGTWTAGSSALARSLPSALQGAFRPVASGHGWITGLSLSLSLVLRLLASWTKQLQVSLTLQSAEAILGKPISQIPSSNHTHSIGPDSSSFLQYTSVCLLVDEGSGEEIHNWTSSRGRWANRGTSGKAPPCVCFSPRALSLESKVAYLRLSSSEFQKPSSTSLLQLCLEKEDFL